jgi:fucose 4-O-acetylase-like acetyltransferase
MLYMPLFFVAAGYTYKNKGKSIKDFVKEKAKRLLVPYAVCNLFLFAFFTIMNRKLSRPGILGLFYSRSQLMRNGTMWNMNLSQYLNAPTWFLTCIFLCYCLYYVIDTKFTDTSKRRKVIVAAMALGVLIRTVSPVLMPWSIENALFFLGYLEVGRVLKEGGLNWLRKNQWIYANLLIGYVALCYIQGLANVSISEYGRSMILYFFTGSVGSILCMKAGELTEKYLKIFAKPMAFVGRNTLPILCWHLFVIEIIKKLIAVFN